MVNPPDRSGLLGPDHSRSLYRARAWGVVVHFPFFLPFGFSSAFGSAGGGAGGSPFFGRPRGVDGAASGPSGVIVSSKAAQLIPSARAIFWTLPHEGVRSPCSILA